MVKQDLGTTGFISTGRSTKETHWTEEEEVSQNSKGSH